MAQTLVDVRWRDIPLLNSAQLGQVANGEGFLRTKMPMPVGTMLIITPEQNHDIRVPARVASVVEVPEAGSGGVQGMQVVFEAAGQLLEPYLEEDLPPVVGLTPQPAFDDEGLADGEPVEPDLPEAPHVDVEAEPVKDSALMPSVSGEIDLQAYRAERGDPDAPDKVIVEVEAELPRDGDEVQAPENGFAQEASSEEDASQQSDDEGGGDDEPGAEGDKKRKRRRKKKKKQ